MGNARYGVLANGFGAKEIADVIRHLYQMLGAAVLRRRMRIAAHATGTRLFGNEHIGALQ
jgi:hypothetical protein